MPTPIKTFRQVRSLVRQNPGAPTRRIIDINNAAKTRQSTLNDVLKTNFNLKQVEKNIADTYKAYGSEPLDFDPERYFGYYDIINDRDETFYNWKKDFAPVPNIKVFAERSLGYRGQNYPTNNFMGKTTMFPYNYSPIYPRQIEIGGRRLEQVPLSDLKFINPQGGYYFNSSESLIPAVAPTPTFDFNTNQNNYNTLKSFTQPYRNPFVDEEIDDLPFKKGGKIHIKKENRGKFTDYCGGKVTSECIARGKASSSPTIRKRATFAANSRKWAKKH